MQKTLNYPSWALPSWVCLHLLAIILLLMPGGCSKPNTPVPDLPGKPPVNTPGMTHPLLDSMVYNQLATTVYFAYRPDSLQDSITTVSSYVSDTDRFVYNGRQLSRIYNQRLGRSTEYTYNAAGKIATTTIVGYADGDYQFEYAYDAAGKLKTLTYFLAKPTNKRLLGTYTYAYDGTGLLTKIKGSTTDGHSITTTIDAYSDECNFNPWAFIEPSDVNEMAEIYNLALMQDLKRLPVKITRTYSNEGVSRHFTTTIQDHNLSKMVMREEFSARPQNNFQFNVDFFYRH